MRRREFIAGLGSAAAWPLAARAQQAVVPVIGYINSGAPEGNARILSAFRQGFAETGFMEGRNVIIEYRWGHDQWERLPQLAADLVERNVSVIVSNGGTRLATMVKAATSRIPVVFELGIDPARTGLVASLARPGGNMTGVNSLAAEAWPKLFDLLVKVLPDRHVFAILSTGGTPQIDEERRQQAQAAAAAVGRKLLSATAITPRDIDDAFATLSQQGVEALVIPASPFSYTVRDQLVALAARYSLPAIYAFRDTVAAGGLMSYSTNLDEPFRMVGVYTGRILKGEKPADLPVWQPTKFEFVINLGTARALGIEVPPGLLAIADEVIE